MKVASFEAIVRALDEAGVRFIVVGGIAVIAHGYGRNTQDVGLVMSNRVAANRRGRSRVVLESRCRAVSQFAVASFSRLLPADAHTR